jgi:hypothetical protein
MRIDLELSGLHSIEHGHKPGFYAHAAVIELRVIPEHVQALIAVLFRQGNAGAFQRFAAPVPWPSPTQLSSPASERPRMRDGSAARHAIGFGHVDNIGVTIPCELHGREGMRRTTSDIPFNGVKVIQTGPLPMLVRVRHSV